MAHQCNDEEQLTIYQVGCIIELVLSTFWGTVENMCLLLRRQFRQFTLARTHTPHGEPVFLKEAIESGVTIAEVQVVRVVITVPSTRPPKPAVANTVLRAGAEVAGGS